MQIIVYATYLYTTVIIPHITILGNLLKPQAKDWHPIYLAVILFTLNIINFKYIMLPHKINNKKWYVFTSSMKYIKIKVLLFQN